MKYLVFDLFIDFLVNRILNIRDERACINSKFSMENVLERFLFITCDASKKPNERVFFRETKEVLYIVNLSTYEIK